VALEAGLNWMGMVEQIEKANLEPHLTNLLEAKKRIGGVNKVDGKDAAGSLTLLRSGTLPEVWYPRGNQRDLRGLTRSRLVIARHVSEFKCRIHGVLTQYRLKPLADEEEEIEYRDRFTVKARQALLQLMDDLSSAMREGLRQEYLAIPSGVAGVDALASIDARNRLDPGRHDLDRDRGGESIRQCRTAGGLCGLDPAHAFLGRKDLARTDAARFQPLPEMAGD
jgi:hypothetical protein